MAGMLQILTYLLAFYLVVKASKSFRSDWSCRIGCSRLSPGVPTAVPCCEGHLTYALSMMFPLFPLFPVLQKRNRVSCLIGVRRSEAEQMGTRRQHCI